MIFITASLPKNHPLQVLTRLKKLFTIERSRQEASILFGFLLITKHLGLIGLRINWDQRINSDQGLNNNLLNRRILCRGASEAAPLGPWHFVKSYGKKSEASIEMLSHLSRKSSPLFTLI